MRKYKLESKRTGEGTNTAKQPSELQIRIADIIGAAYTECIYGTEECDTSEELMQLEKRENVFCSSWASSSTFLELTDKATFGDILIKSDETDQKVSSNDLSFLNERETQNLEILQAEKEIVLAVNTMNDELKRTNTLIDHIVEEMKKKKLDSTTNFESFAKPATIAQKRNSSTILRRLAEQSVTTQLHCLELLTFNGLVHLVKKRFLIQN